MELALMSDVFLPRYIIRVIFSMLLLLVQALLNNSHYYHMAKDDFASRGIKGILSL